VGKDNGLVLIDHFMD